MPWRFEQTLQHRKATLGLDHPDTLTSMINLARAYQSANRLRDAFPLYEQAQASANATLGPEHPTTLTLVSNLAAAYLAGGQPASALPLLEQFITEHRKRAKPDDPVFAGQLATVSYELLRYGQYTTAETYLCECVTIRERLLPDDWLLFNTKSMLGLALAGQKKFEEAEPLLVEAYQGMKQREDKIPANVKIRVTEAIKRLVDLYIAWDRPQEAEKWRALLPPNPAEADPK
jgi:tetratricopeptide (TPR) repeat protein